MNCYTYTNGETLPGFTSNGINQKTCAFTLKIPYDWDADEIISRLKSRSHADILLYSCVDICQGNSVSSVFPEDCIAICSPEIFTLENYDNSCLEAIADADRVIYILFEDSELFDSATNKYICNAGGVPELSDCSKREEVIRETDDSIIML